jgi:ketosteroid isomerase-like protein
MLLACRIVVLVVAALAASGCQYMDVYGPPPPPPQPIAYGPTTERQIDQALQRYSALIVAMDAAAISEMYAPDGVWERQSGPIQGREAIRRALADAGGVRVLANDMKTAYMSYAGPAVLQTGDFKQTVRLADGKVVEASGRFEATWVRAPNGEWWIRRMVTRPGK